MVDINKIYNDLSDIGKIIFNCAVLLVLMAIVDRTFFGPLLDDQKKVEEDIKQQEIIIKRDLKFLTYQDRIIKEKEIYDKYLLEENRAEGEIKSEFLQSIQKVASKTNVDLLKSNPENIVKEDDYTMYYARVDCSGELKDIISFIHMINSTDNLLKVVQFSLTPKRGTSNQVNLSVNISRMVMIKEG